MAVALGLCLQWGCAAGPGDDGVEPEPTPTPLFDVTTFAIASADDDPADDVPDEEACTLGVQEELDGLEVDTSACDYFVLQTSLDVDVDEGDDINVFAWHQALTSIEPAQGHLAVFIDGALLWEKHVDIPQSAQVFDDVVQAPTSAAAGSTATLHLHNHGNNTWQLQRVEKLPQ